MVGCMYVGVGGVRDFWGLWVLGFSGGGREGGVREREREREREKDDRVCGLRLSIRILLTYSLYRNVRHQVNSR